MTLGGVPQKCERVPHGSIITPVSYTHLVHVRLPQNAAFDADISTSSGTLDVNAPVTMTVQGRVQEGRKHIEGKVRGGGPSLRVRTGSGDIHIE